MGNIVKNKKMMPIYTASMVDGATEDVCPTYIMMAVIEKHLSPAFT